MKLIHLFPQLMNLYGDRGNLLLLRRCLEQKGVEVLPGGEDTDLTQGDFLYMGPGTEPALERALELLRPKRAELAALLERETPMLLTGNAWLLLGQELTDPDGKALEGLGLLDFQVTQSRERLTADTVALDGQGRPAVGFQNRCDRVVGVERPLFTLEMGPGNAPGDNTEGLRRGNLYATHLTGPLLVKNPHLLREMAGLLGAEDVETDPEAQKAYEVTLTALRGRMANGH